MLCALLVFKTGLTLPKLAFLALCYGATELHNTCTIHKWHIDQHIQDYVLNYYYIYYHGIIFMFQFLYTAGF